MSAQFLNLCEKGPRFAISQTTKDIARELEERRRGLLIMMRLRRRKEESGIERDAVGRLNK